MEFPTELARSPGLSATSTAFSTPAEGPGDRDFIDTSALAATDFFPRATFFAPRLQRLRVIGAWKPALDLAIRTSSLRVGHNASPELLPERVLAITPKDEREPFAGLLIIDYGSNNTDAATSSVTVETVILMGRGAQIQQVVDQWLVGELWLMIPPARTPVKEMGRASRQAMDLELIEVPYREWGEKEPATQTLAFLAVEYVKATRIAKHAKADRMERRGDLSMKFDDEELEVEYLRDVLKAVRTLGNFWVNIFGGL